MVDPALLHLQITFKTFPSVPICHYIVHLCYKYCPYSPSDARFPFLDDFVSTILDLGDQYSSHSSYGWLHIRAGLHTHLSGG